MLSTSHVRLQGVACFSVFQLVSMALARASICWANFPVGLSSGGGGGGGGGGDDVAEPLAFNEGGGGGGGGEY